MGLAIQVALLADLTVNDAEGAAYYQSAFERVNKALAAAGEPTYTEPVQVAPLKSRTPLMSFPYGFLHHLRRAYAYAVEQPGTPYTPVEAGEDPAKDPVVDDLMYMFESHLLCHSDCEGFYVPVPLDEPVFDREHDVAGGGMIGSSAGLAAELRVTAPLIGIELRPDGTVDDAEIERVFAAANAEKTPVWREQLVWLALFEAARLSVAHGAAIVFC